MKVAQLLGLWGPWQQVCRDADCLCRRSYGPLRVFFQLLVAVNQKASLASLSLKPRPFRHLEGFLPGVLLCCSTHQAHRGAPSLGSYSVVQCIRHLMGQPLYCSAANAWGMHEGRETMVMAPPLTRDSAVSPCFHCCQAFLHRHFPPHPPLSYPLDQSLRSQQQPLPWDCSTVPKFPLPATVPSRVCMAVARTI